jgi:predicted MFS family arabinose efflux permease
MRPPRSHARRLLVGAVALSVALLGLQLAVSLPTLCLLAFVAGLPIAPTIAALYTLIDTSARTGTAAEAFAWFGTAVSLGIATGTALAGVVVEERGVDWAFGFGAAVAFGGVLLAWARRSTFVVDKSSAIPEGPGEPSTLLSERP